METIADQLWIVRNGAVQPFDGDMNDYRKLLLQQQGGKGRTATSQDAGAETATGNPSGNAAARPARALSGKERRANTAAVRSAITRNEKELAALNQQKAALEAEMAAPGFFDAANSSESAEAGRRLVALNNAIEAAEDAWLTLQEELEAALAE